MVGCKILPKKREQEWLSSFLGSKFFGVCVDHWNLGKNEKNMFCIDCSLCFCKHCITSSAHCFHRCLQICRYVYHDVVRVQDIQKHLDCSKIQTYKINGEKAVHLNPRPQSKDAKPSKLKGGASCETCERRMQDFPNRFCSIACKALVVKDILCKDERQDIISIPISEFDDLPVKENYFPEEHFYEVESCLSLAESSEEIQTWVVSALKPKKQLHKRKGVPRRAPFH